MKAGEWGARLAGRYAIYDEIAAGGMATVHFGRSFGTAGFSHTVAIKRLHPQFAKDPDFAAMFLDEAHVAARIRHPNVIATLDVVGTDGELFIVMEYVHGETLARLLRIRDDKAGLALPPRIAAAIASTVLHGLHAAHEAKNEAGEPLGIVHRDVSPQNVLVGTDGVARVLDFGIAKARDRIHITRGGLLKGKVAYMAPEQLAGATVDRRTDVYATGVLLWEALVGKRLFFADGDFAVAEKVRTAAIDPPGKLVRGLPEALDAIALRALAKSADDRFQSAREMAFAIEEAVGIATPSEVGAWVESLAAPSLEVRAKQMAAIERGTRAAAAPVAIVHDDPDPDGSAPTRAIDPDGSAPTRAIEAVVQAPVSGTRAGIALAPAPRSSRGAWLVGAGAGIALCVGIAGFAFFARGPRAAAVPIATAPSAPAVETTAPTAPPSASAAQTGASVTPEPSASSTAEATSAATANATSGAAPRASTAPKPAPTARPKVSCDPPYVVDARGVRHLKRECL